MLQMKSFGGLKYQYLRGPPVDDL